MPLHIVRNDITKMEVDAIVNAANSSLLGGGGVDGAIHRAAGNELLEECRGLGGCETGKAKITRGYKLPSKYVIHTVGPVYGKCGGRERELLESCYRESLKLAAEHRIKSIAFPLISSGAYGYPKDEALGIAMGVISQALFEMEMTVYIVVFDKKSYKMSKKIFSDVTEYIDDNYYGSYDPRRFRRDAELQMNLVRDRATEREEYSKRRFRVEALPSGFDDFLESDSFDPRDLDGLVKKLDESFSQMLLRKIDERGMTDVECYKKANISRKLFSKIRGDVNYKPSKPTAIAFAISLELSLSETEKLLEKAGYALSHSNKFDIIIEYFIKHRHYNIFEINEVLFAFDQSLLGG